MNFVKAIVALSAALSVGGSVAFAAGMGDVAGPTQPLSSPNAYNTAVLTYSGFTGGACTIAGFAQNATGNDAANGIVDINQTQFLNGVAAGGGAFSLGPGPFTFPTTFNKAFTAPAPATNTYTLVVNSAVSQAGNLLGNNITTITCTAGVLSTTSVFNAAASLPTMSEWSLAVMALLLALAGGTILYRRRARF